jgi:hypothetical protein
MEKDRRIDNQIIGFAGTYAVASELLFRHYIVQPMSIDAGVDLVCWMNDKRYDVQVKTATENKNSKIFIYKVRKKSFDKLNRTNSFFVFVLRMLQGTNKFVVIPSSLLKGLIDEGKLYLMQGDYRVSLKVDQAGIVHLKGKSLLKDLSCYVDSWDLTS